MGVPISELYNKRVISSGGKVLGDVKGIILNLDEGRASHILLGNIDDLTRSKTLKSDFFKNTVDFKRVRKIAESIIVSEAL